MACPSELIEINNSLATGDVSLEEDINIGSLKLPMELDEFILTVLMMPLLWTG